MKKYILYLVIFFYFNNIQAQIHIKWDACLNNELEYVSNEGLAREYKNNKLQYEIYYDLGLLSYFLLFDTIHTCNDTIWISGLTALETDAYSDISIMLVRKKRNKIHIKKELCRSDLNGHFFLYLTKADKCNYIMPYCKVKNFSAYLYSIEKLMNHREFPLPDSIKKQ